MAYNPSIFVVDLDGTIADQTHRVGYVLNKQWDEYHSQSKYDLPFPEIVEFLKRFNQSVPHGFASRLEFICLTGRNAKFRAQTLEWLRRYEIEPDELLMRPDGDFTPDHKLKPTMLANYLEVNLDHLKEEVLFVMEDRERVVEAWRNLGVPCWQVRQGAF